MGWLRFAAMMGLIGLLAACSAAQGAGIEEVARPTMDPANAGLVARVNGVGVPEALFLRELERRSADTNAVSDDALEREVLETFIRQELIKQGAPSLGVVVTDDDVQTEYDNLRSLSPSDEDWAAFLETNRYTAEEMFAAQRDALTTQRVQSVLMSAYLGNVEQVNARHIVVPTRDEAESILERLQNGEGFATLAAELSLDSTTRDIGGNLGWFAHSELFYSNLEDIAFQLEPGQIAGPIATSLGYHVLETLDKAERPVEPERLPMLSESIFNHWLDEQYRLAVIERYR